VLFPYLYRKILLRQYSLFLNSNINHRIHACKWKCTAQKQSKDVMDSGRKQVLGDNTVLFWANIPIISYKSASSIFRLNPVNHTTVEASQQTVKARGLL
jgi:hypothetical protein